MGKNKFSTLALAGILASTVVSLPACSVNVRKEANGQDKQVDINTLLGGVHVSKQADLSDIGLNVYPGAHMREKDSDDSDKSANVNISGFGYGIKVVALEYETNDDPAKVLAFYRDQLKKYGSVLECHTSGHFNVDMKMGHDSKISNELTCDGKIGRNVELKVGRRDDQHIVAVESQGTGSSFSLVYVRTHGKDDDI
jgi:hypothetical protein